MPAPNRDLATLRTVWAVEDLVSGMRQAQQSPIKTAIKRLGCGGLKRTARRALGRLTPGQRRVVEAFRNINPRCTYVSVAAQLGLHVGTVYSVLRTVRIEHPAVYKLWQSWRADQLTVRHANAVRRVEVRRRAWFRRRRMEQIARRPDWYEAMTARILKDAALRREGISERTYRRWQAAWRVEDACNNDAADGQS